LVIGGEHAGFAMKTRLIEALRSWGREVEDLGSFDQEAVDFPDIAEAVGRSGRALP
jgi:ribose 5-phosphate isomerase B